MADPSWPLTGRQRQIAATARELLDAEGPEALTMRRLADALGIKAPSLYKHVPDKTALEALLIADGFAEFAAAMEAAFAGTASTGKLAAIGGAYRRYAVEHPHLYRLMNYRNLRRDLLPDGLEARASLPLLDAAGHDEARARAMWAFAHGMVSLEIDGRFPPGADLDDAWAAGLAAFSQVLSLRLMSQPVSFYEAVGGEETFRRLVHRFYQGVAEDPVLRPVYPAKNLGPAEEHLTLFLIQYWGGPRTYDDLRGHPRLRMRHNPFRIGEAERDAWLHHMRESLDELNLDEALDAQLWDYLVMAAHSLVNVVPERPDLGLSPA